MQALIFAAGKGERLRPHTDILAKPAIPFLNVPILGYPLFYLQQAGINEVMINTHHLPVTIQRAAETLAGKKINVAFSHEPNEILGSGGGLAQAVQLAKTKVADDLVIVNGDMVALYSNTKIVNDLMKRHKDSNALATLLVCPFPNAKESFGGVYADQLAQVKQFSKTKLNNPSLTAWHFTGLMIVNREVWQGLSTKPSNLLYEILQPKIDQGAKVMTLTLEKTDWFETGNAPDYLNATEKALKILATPSVQQQTLIQILDRYSPGWWKGWRLPTNDDGYLLCSLPWPDRMKVTGFAVAGPLALISSHVHLERSVVAGFATLEEKTHLKNKLLVVKDEPAL